jgi:hypothetical protein
VNYRLEIQLASVSENPTPLTTGAAPAVSIQLVGSGPVSDVPPAVLFTRTTASNDNFVIPSGLMAGLNAPALGSQTITAPIPTRDTAIVRLFGFSERLFALIDSSLPRTSNSLTVTQAELTDAELLDLVDQARTAAEVESSAQESAETESSESSETESDVERNELRARNPEDSPPTTLNSQPADKKQSSNSGTRRGRPSAANLPADNQQSSTSGTATTFALASTLAVTLRDRSRREPDSDERRRPIADRNSINPHDWN